MSSEGKASFVVCFFSSPSLLISYVYVWITLDLSSVCAPLFFCNDSHSKASPFDTFFQGSH